MQRLPALIVALSAAALPLAACGSGGGGNNGNTDSAAAATSTTTAESTSSSVTPTTDPDYHPDIVPSDFTTEITNPYFPLTPGTTLVYEGTRDGKPQRGEVVVTSDTREILGVTCVVVKDTVTSNGALVEQTTDWYAQSSNGDVWYFGEDTAEYENGVVSSTHGTWEAGVDGAQAGVVMTGDPKIGDSYRQEYRPGEAEDKGEVLRFDPSLEVPAGRYENVLVTLDSDPLNPSKNDNKWYAPGIGLAKTTRVATGHQEEVTLVEVQTG